MNTHSFPDQPSRPFTAAEIKNIQGNPDGVYGIYRSGAWIYIGKGDIKTRLLSHFNGDNPKITAENPTHWVGVVLGTAAERTEWEKALILKHEPLANQKVG